MRRGALVTGLLLAAPLLAAPPVPQPDADTDAEACTAVRAFDYTDAAGAAVRFGTTSAVDAAGGQPAYCRIAGRIEPAVGFEVRLPRSGWNGKLLVTGCANLCGYVNSAGLAEGLARGYAVATTDMGHQGDPADARWALNNPQAEIDFGHRATHLTTRLAKALVAAYFGNAPEYAYFNGCSTGGRQGLVAAWRYPGDFDGIVAGAPFNQALSVPHMAWVLAANAGADGKPLLGAREFTWLAEAALADCDAGDGLPDGVIGDPERCRFDPAQLACGADGRAGRCLTAAQVNAATRIYAGPRNSAGQALVTYAPGGAPVGSEPSWAASLLPRGAAPAFFDFVVQNWSRHLAYEPDPAGPGPWRFDFDRDPQRLRATVQVAGFRPELDAFRRRGGRLIVYHGWSDESLMPAHTLDYWRELGERLGGDAARAELARLYMVPGMGHCAGGPGFTAVDYLGALERWVEADEAPDELTAARVPATPVATPAGAPAGPLPTGAVTARRPLYPYPDVAVYRGSGNPDSAGSFVRRSPGAAPR